ncbi:HAMP domain-containing sensor histidine kinase [Thalassobaculum sp.]|uniref:sensor histidine kinase n=1 Tax=Thalassobaculum sp. TaxID=2022740 RepID=UPI0032EB4E90
MVQGANIAPPLDDRTTVAGGGVSIEALPAAVVVLSDDRIVDVNANGLCLAGVVDRAELVGRPFAEVVVVGDPVSADHGGAGSSDGGGIRWRHALIRPVAGAAAAILVSQGPDWIVDGQTTRLVLLVPSVANGDEALDADARHEARGRIADVFANLAHEMRTPLNAVIGFGEILVGEHFGPLAARYKDYSRDIVGAGYHLLALVNGALDLGRASAGPDTLDERPVELRAVLTSTIAMLQHSATLKSITVEIVDLTGLPLIYADETRMRQLFVNLISNAIKYSPVGRGVTIKHWIEDDGRVCIDVIDGGVGMSREEVAIALLPFGRTDSAMRTGEAGTGLGLPICKAIVEAHGGRLTIDSAPRRGTTISVILPANRLVAAPGHGGLLNLL